MGHAGLPRPVVAASAHPCTLAGAATSPAAPRSPARVPPCARRGVVAHAAASDDDQPEPKLGPNVAAGIRDVQKRLEWRAATVTRNDAASLDGGQRLLHLSVADDVRLSGHGVVYGLHGSCHTDSGTGLATLQLRTDGQAPAAD
jgi:hypothetical protein